MCQFDPNLCPVGICVKEKGYLAYTAQSFGVLEEFDICLREVNPAFKGRTRQGLTQEQIVHT